jgi:hypothetical protein
VEDLDRFRIGVDGDVAIRQSVGRLAEDVEIHERNWSIQRSHLAGGRRR